MDGSEIKDVDAGLDSFYLEKPQKSIGRLRQAIMRFEGPSRPGLRQILMLLFGLACLSLLLWLFRDALGDLLALLNDRDTIVAALQDLGVWGPLLFAALQFLQVIVAIVPGHMIMVISGYVYGFAGGFILNLVTVIAASQLAFYLARRAGRPVVIRFVSSEVIERWTGVIQRHGLLFFLISFMIPVFPADVLNFVAGLTPMSAKSFLTASLLGRLPALVLMTLVGSRGAALPVEVWIIAAVAMVVLLIAWRYDFKALKRRYFSSEPCQVCNELIEICEEQRDM